MQPLICRIMSTKFAVNVYDGDLAPQVIDTNLLGGDVDATQAVTVREILDRYQITGIAYGRDPSRDSYITELSEDEDTSERSQKVNDALDTPDLSYMDEMEIHDYVKDNISLTNDVQEGTDQRVESGENQPMVEPGSE